MATETVELGYQQLLAIVLQATAAVEAHGKELELLHGQIAELRQRLSAVENPQNGKKDDHGCDEAGGAVAQLVRVQFGDVDRRGSRRGRSERVVARLPYAVEHELVGLLAGDVVSQLGDEEPWDRHLTAFVRFGGAPDQPLP